MATATRAARATAEYLLAIVRAARVSGVVEAAAVELEGRQGGWPDFIERGGGQVVVNRLAYKTVFAGRIRFDYCGGGAPR
jgi:hypothetical protein